MTTPQPGKTKTVDLGGVTFLDNNKQEIPQNYPGLAIAVYVTFLFADQENGKPKNEVTTLFCVQSPTSCLIDRTNPLTSS